MDKITGQELIRSKLEKLFPIAVRLIHYVGFEDCDYVYEVNMNFNAPMDTILNTRCGSTFNTIKFLLDLQNMPFPVDNLDDIFIDYVYRLELTGYDEHNTEIITGHVFSLVWLDEWVIIDSYFPDRTLTINSIDINILNKLLKDISLSFNQDLWRAITNHNSVHIPYRVVVSINALKFDIYSVSERVDRRFKELVMLSLEHLKTDSGQSDEYVAILGLQEIDIGLAEKYLQSLLQ